MCQAECLGFPVVIIVMSTYCVSVCQALSVHDLT